ncbi:hypothetical protein K469DRAFT_684309 [Zopfia rhizophila CBS 207.26]|uniref:AAA+ ATPase domain-containing protein n=1 Tax=Zopfia rhizophila CBS 207.26 TaxID=1314779 RepID=A0A6A6EE21_9PEZI|nr:hypothetical protein K469DRAFT_684309 [Zopfia rhizophila CBS 207.26]
MALAAVQTAMNLDDTKGIHPFFAKPHRDPSPERETRPKETAVEKSNDDANYDPADNGAQPVKGRKRRSRRSDGQKDKKNGPQGKNGQASLDKFAKKPNGLNATESIAVPLNDGLQVPEGPSLEEDANAYRRKRRKTVSPTPTRANEPVETTSIPRTEGLNWYQQLELEAGKDDARNPVESAGLGPSNSSAANAIVQAASTEERKYSAKAREDAILPSRPAEEPTTSTATIGDPVGSEGAPNSSPKKTTPKKKVLKTNKNGKLLSPGASKAEPEASSNQKRRQGRKSTKPKQSPTVTIIQYGSDAESRRTIGSKIEDILNGRKQPVAWPATPPKAPAKPAGPPKPTHPFFLGKPSQKKDEPAFTKTEVRLPQSPRTPRKSVVTPGKLKHESRLHSPRTGPLFGPVSGDARLMKHPGMSDATWPSKDTTHVRNLDSDETVDLSSIPITQPRASGIRKLKSSVITVAEDEDLISRFSRQLKSFLQMSGEQDSLVFERSDNVRFPKRLLTTGIDIQERVRREVHAPLAVSDELGCGQRGVHPALNALFQGIEHNLIPFDKGECETQAWTHKYGPRSATEILQSGKEAIVLRDWLKSLTVIAVESAKIASKAADCSEPKKPPKKKRKKAEDDFIVSSDEEDGDMVELSDSEGYGQPNSRYSIPKSVRRPKASRNKNVVILSGPYGCGKSAAVYAVAKELGFEVFEINSSSRRSGKDIQDKVGDMSENHLVSHKPTESRTNPEPVAAEDTDNERMSEAFQKDLESGRQGTMTSFFKATVQTKAKPKTKAKPTKDTQRRAGATQATLQKPQLPRRYQKQSLILFEEADVLFEEDQQFWAQVIRLASQSKRPIVITCNNENLIPAYDLPLGAILRFSPPPVDLATDYMLLLAAKEGHVLERKAVRDLFKSKNHDLRASITELDFWCQMSVGDRKGGLEWIYQRWPPGKDVDEHGRVLRVASEGTYYPGMGWLSHDIFKSNGYIGFDKEEEVLKETWEDWGVAPYCWNDYEKGSLSSTVASSEGTEKRLQELIRFDSMLDSVSAADIYCHVGLPSYEKQTQEPIDPSLPPMPDKERSNYTEAAPVLQIDPVSDFASFDTSMFVQSYIRIQRAFTSDPSSKAAAISHTMPMGEDESTKAILQYKQKEQTEQSLSWPDFSEAFDILASPPTTSLAISTSYQLTASSFDRAFKIVVHDLAPFVRSIVSHEVRLEAERLRLSNLLSEGGRRKRPRTTRASRVALEGGRRETKRRERWFDKDLNRTLVMATAGKAWSGLGSMSEEAEGSTTATSLKSTQEE